MADEVLSAAERQQVIDRRLDEIDRALLGLLSRSDRLAVVADVETRLRSVSDACFRQTVDTPVDAPVVSPVASRPGTAKRRSRMAFTSGVLGIVAAACLIVSPILLIVLSAVGDLLGETFSILLFAALTLLVTCGGACAVGLGVIGLLRLSRRGQTATGTGWAITGLCTGSLPMLIGLVGVLSLAATILPSESVQVSWSAGPGGPGAYQVTSQPVMYAAPPTLPNGSYCNELPAMLPPSSGPQPYGVPPTPMVAPVPFSAPSMPMPVAPSVAAVPPAVPTAPVMLPSAPVAEPKPTAKAEPAKETKPEAKAEAKPEVKAEAKPAAAAATIPSNTLPAVLPKLSIVEEEEEKLGIEFKE